MIDLLLVTGNQHKLEEWRRLVPASVNLESVDIDLDEVQSDDPRVIMEDKVRRAYEIVQRPVIVEDISAGLDRLGGLPGPFVKFFISRLGPDALWQLSGMREEPMTVSCAAAYFDGKGVVAVQGSVRGTVVAPRGESYGFSATFMPDGQTKTYAEMTDAEKDAISHRSIAVKALIKKLEALGGL